MTWGFVAGAAVTVVGGVLNAKKQNKAAGAQRDAGLQQETAALDQNLADNQAINAANLQNTIRTGYKTGLLNIQKAQAKKDLLAQGFQIGAGKMAMLSAATANAAGAGSIGSSVDAVLSDIEGKADQAQAEHLSNWGVAEHNFETQLGDIIMQGTDSIRSAVKVGASKTAAAQHIGMGEVLTTSAVQIAGSYFGSKMSLGMGTKSSGDAPMRTFNVQPGTAPTGAIPYMSKI